VVGAEHVSASDTRTGRGLDDTLGRLHGAGVRIYRRRARRALDQSPTPRTLVKSPGIRFDTPLIELARERGIEVIDELELGWRLCRAPIVGVTGTNGKSTVASLIAAILRAGGQDATVAGNYESGPALSGVTSDPDWVVCEASSFQLEGCPRLLPEVGVFTNLTHDHLARHGSMHAYAELKRRLFVRGDAAVPLAVVNSDDELGSRLAVEIESRDGRVIRFGTTRLADYRLERARWDLHSAEVRISTPGDAVDLATRLPGRHNALNVAAALALADAVGVQRSVAVGAIARQRGLPGRFEPISEPPRSCNIVVDVAISPDAVAQVLRAARATMSPGGRLTAVVGIFGSAEPEHCRQMTVAACELADELVLTSGSFLPGSSVAGLESLVAGAPPSERGRVTVHPSRVEAIAASLRGNRLRDVVVLLGRGRFQEVLRPPHGPPRVLDDIAVASEFVDGVVARVA
jgi:UDP-N-acetylmuramoylalanine--D-glutamate ligase